MMTPVRGFGVVLLLLFSLPSFLLSQEAWNDPRVLDLIGEARRLRQTAAVDSQLRSYASQARGFVYFFLDREDTGERILVKTDQIALEVFWQAPGRTKQRIVGLRDEKSLPTNIQYHLDHLVVVQDEFGDRIRIGDGDEVEAVVHPAAPASELVYDFLLADSVTLILQGGADTVRVYEVRVRPKDFETPGFIGSVFLDRDAGAIVRMSFTFTPASYVDDYLDHIQISLENGLWLGRYWLPYRQELEIRREVPFLDIPAGSVIRGWFEIRDYQINPPIPDSFFEGSRITALPQAVRQAFSFEDSLQAHLEEEGLQGRRTPPSMEEIRALALEIARKRYLSGLGRLRLFLPKPTVSSAFRFNRAEGLFVGGGFSYGASPALNLAVHAGFSFGRERPAVKATLSGGERRPGSHLAVLWNQPTDLGPLSAISGALNTLAALGWNEDYQDLFFVSGLRAAHSWTPMRGWRLGAEGRWEAHDPSRDVVSSDSLEPRFRPVLPTEEGVWTSVSMNASFPTPFPSLQGEAQLLAGSFRNRAFGALNGTAIFRHSRPTVGWDFRGELRAGALLGAPPLQAHYFLGGRETVPGHPFRSRAGDRFWILKGEASRELLHPWVRLRALGAAGHAWGGEGRLDPSLRGNAGSSFFHSLGMGLGIGWDVLRLDLARGLGRGGDWALILSVNRDFWAWL